MIKIAITKFNKNPNKANINNNNINVQQFAIISSQFINSLLNKIISNSMVNNG